MALFALIVQLAYTGRNVYITANASTMDWGLSFFEEGETPQGSAEEEYLKNYDAYFVGNTDEKVVYLTFDCGYENGYTNTILDVLKEKNVKAAFFVVGHMIESSPDIVKRMADEGHLVCNHTYSHPDATLLSQSELTNELTKLENTAREICGIEISKYFRPPAGKFSEQMLINAQNAGYTTVFWSLAYADWDVNNQPTHKNALDKLVPRIHNGAIILLHSTSATNSEILSGYIDELISQGYRFGTLDELNAQ